MDVICIINVKEVLRMKKKKEISKSNNGFALAVAMIIGGLFILSAVVALFGEGTITGFAVYNGKVAECKSYHGDNICDDSKDDCGINYAEGTSHDYCNECQTIYNGKRGYEQC